MLTPIEIHNTIHKTGRGYAKKEMDEFLSEVIGCYEKLYKENIELRNNVEKLSGEMDYYRSMEQTLQKALVLAEKTSKDTIDTANAKAEVIEKEANIEAEQTIREAKAEAEQIIRDANAELAAIKKSCIMLINQYNQFKMQYKQIAEKQVELLESDFYEIYCGDLIKSINEVENTSDVEEPEQVEIEEEIQTIIQEETEEVEEVEEVETGDDIPLVDLSDEVSKEDVSDMEIPEVEISSSEDFGVDVDDDLVEAESKTMTQVDPMFTTKEIPSIDMDSFGSLLKDLRENVSSDGDSDDNHFEFLNNN